MIENYEPKWRAANVDYDAAWNIRRDGSGITADRMRTVAQLAAWHQMRMVMPPEHWSADACDAMTEAVLRVVRDWVEAP